MAVANSRYEAIHNINMMMYLVRQGFNVVGVEDNLTNKTKKVFIFIKSNELSKAMKSYKRG